MRSRRTRKCTEPRSPWFRASLLPWALTISAACSGGGGMVVGCAQASDARSPGYETSHRFQTDKAAEVVATIRVGCDACAWDKAGSEAVVLSIVFDDRSPQHLPIVRSGRSEYRVMLGPAAPGEHTFTITEDANLTAADLRGKAAAQWAADVDFMSASDAGYEALALAPIVYARTDTVGRFTDVPLLMWYEIEPTDRGRRYRYSVIFSNEDGGTPADRLMATWGRTTDIEYLYSIEVDASGSILSEDMQGPEHEILPFRGRREGGHPLLWVSTDNNMVLDQGATSVRYAPAPALVNLDKVSRETVMDANPWTYEVMAKELSREGKIVADAPPGRGVIPDPRRFIFVEACGEAGPNAITASVKVGGAWHSSDRGIAEYRIVRDGCFRAAIPLPGSATARDVSAIRFQAYPRKDRRGGVSRITRLNRVFSLDERVAPGASVMQWEGAAILKAGGPPLEIPVR